VALGPGRLLRAPGHAAPHPAFPLCALRALFLDPDLPHRLLAQGFAAVVGDVPRPEPLLRLPAAGAQARLLAADRDGAGGAAGAALPAGPRAAAAGGGARRGALPRWLPHVRGEPVRALGVPAGGGPGLALPLRVHALGAAPERHHDAAAAPAAGG